MLEDREKIREKENHRVFKQLLTTFIEENNLEENIENIQYAENIKIVPKIFYDDFSKIMKAEFKIGEKQLYKIKNLPEFYEKMLHQEPYKYGIKLNLVNRRESFTKESISILNFILKYAEIMKYNNEVAQNYTTYSKNYELNHIIISNIGLDDLFETLKDTKIDFERNGKEKKVYFDSKEAKIPFSITQIEEDKFELKIDIDIFDYDILEGKDYIYLLLKDCLYRYSKKNENNILKILNIFRKNYINAIYINKEELINFYSVIFPNIQENNIENNLSNSLKEECIPKKLNAKIFLDYDKNNYITADIKFCYENIEFNPLVNQHIKMARNTIKENAIFSKLIKTGFMLDKVNSRLILAKEEQIYNFLTYEIEEYMKQYEILVTDNLKSKEIRGFQIKNIGVKIKNSLLEIDLSQIGIDLSELSQMIKKYKLKKKFHRLKDGSFIELEQNETMKFLDELTSNLEIDEENIKNGVITIPAYRTLYLEKMLKSLKNVNIKKDETYKRRINKLENNQNDADDDNYYAINADLRTYQKIGIKWLKTLDEYSLGGILADDMGLGKTIQVLCLISSYIKNKKELKEKYYSSIIVCPSSLTLNWLGEIQKFTPNLKTIVINGNVEQRENKIKKINEYDITIISYDSLKRDIEIFKEQNITFKYMIADEAQYIKNNNTQNAKAIKKIISQTRFALTGTPIENSISELWSIFDFIMPGYLFKYKKFKELYEIPIVKENNSQQMEKLKKLIEPFVLRRTKKEVLTELPDKTVTVLYNEMEEEQQTIYLSYLAQAKKEVKEEININGIEGSRMKILALLMRLRQICCHPTLFLKNYDGESSKLNQCIEIIKEAVESGHKILLFSGYTSMFDIIEKELKKNKINYFKLTGKTKISERIELVDKFNEDENIKIFLISLRAGGTGLNLTGADMVIHYDPWWNLSAENQATDRTYRIGQKNNVQVYKLITKNSIEEKIYELQNKKEELIDNVLSTKSTFINQLSKQDIIDLFG